MPRTCTICNSPSRESIERALLAGESYRHIAARFDTSTGALQRHRAEHLPSSLTKAHTAVEVARADTLLDEVRSGGNRAERLYGHAETILERAMESKDLKTALGAIGAAVSVMREGRAYLELRGEISGELDKPPNQFPLGIGPVGQLNMNAGPERMLVLSLPKTPAVDAEERRRLRAVGLLPPAPDQRKPLSHPALPVLAIPPYGHLIRANGPCSRKSVADDGGRSNAGCFLAKGSL
jgi:hypothetical protein